MDKKNIKRFNMAFTKENYDYISFIAGASEMSMTDAINDIVSAEREKNAETVNTIKKMLKNSKGER